MRWALLVLCGLLALGTSAGALDAGSPEDVLTRYLGALKDSKPDVAYDLISKAMRQGKDKALWVKEHKAMMALADVKIFDFSVHPGKVEGDKALVPNVLESQDKFVNTLGLTEHELYTLVREEGAWRVDSQILLEQGELAKWFPAKRKDDAGTPKSH